MKKGKNHLCKNFFMKFTYTVNCGWLNINVKRKFQYLSSQTTICETETHPIMAKVVSRIRPLLEFLIITSLNGRKSEAGGMKRMQLPLPDLAKHVRIE